MKFWQELQKSSIDCQSIEWYNYLTRNHIYAMGMGEETMELINFREVSNGQ